MATMSDLHARADELLSLGLTKHRAFRRLRKEFPQMERDQLLKAIALPGAPKGVTPEWALGGAPLKSVQFRFPPNQRALRVNSKRKAGAMSDTAEPLTIAINAADIDVGDWIEGHGIVRDVLVKDTMVVATFKDGQRGFHPKGQVRVRLEDRGETDE